MKKIRKVLAGILIILILLTLISIKPVDYSGFAEKEYYQKTSKAISRISEQKPPNQILVGWAMESITPEEPIRLTGLRNSAYENIRDSVFVRTFAFRSGSETVLMIIYDLWIIHPKLAETIRNSVLAQFPEYDKVYFSATHTHSSIGGWASGLLGRLIIGGNSTETLEFIRRQTLRSVESAVSDLKATRLSYGENVTSGLTVNRLNRVDGPLDETLRQLNFNREDGSRAAIYSYQAHTVFLSKDVNELSADYPAAFLRELKERDSLQLNAFMAGAMGSHTPVIENKDDSYESMEAYGKRLAEFVDPGVLQQMDSLNVLEFHQIPVSLPSATFRISENWKLKEGIFNSLMGSHPSEITVLKLGTLLFVGLPIELSGEYNLELGKMAKENGLNLIVTSFNGNYLGYAPVDHYYNEVKKAETRTMNWYGPHSGSYFKQLIEEIILTY